MKSMTGGKHDSSESYNYFTSNSHCTFLSPLPSFKKTIDFDSNTGPGNVDGGQSRRTFSLTTRYT
jgi:hypothetical protein